MQVVTPALTTGAAVLALHRVLLELQQHMRQHQPDGARSLIAFTMGEASAFKSSPALACISSIHGHSPIPSLGRGPRDVGPFFDDCLGLLRATCMWQFVRDCVILYRSHPQHSFSHGPSGVSQLCCRILKSVYKCSKLCTSVIILKDLVLFKYHNEVIWC